MNKQNHLKDIWSVKVGRQSEESYAYAVSSVLLSTSGEINMHSHFKKKLMYTLTLQRYDESNTTALDTIRMAL